MARVAIYARYSSDLQNPRSIEDQEALCRRWCEREGHGVVATFSDAALSGASIHGRSGLKSMIAGAVERQFDVVVVESFDRVARSQSELPQVWEMLRFCGCELIAVDDGRASEISIGVRGLVGIQQRAADHLGTLDLGGDLRELRRARGRQEVDHRSNPGTADLDRVRSGFTGGDPVLEQQ